jgi:hypothetical protein
MPPRRPRASRKDTAPAPGTAPGFDFALSEVEEWFAEEEAQGGPSKQEATTADDVAAKYARSQLRVVRETKDFTLDYLQHALRSPNYIVNVSPEYQRRQRWSAKKRSLLIESFLMNIPIPPVFLFERDYNAYEVVDGRQRLDTIREFLENNFALAGLEYWAELNGLRFKKLPVVIQRGLIRRSLGAVVLLAETRRPEEDEFDVRTVLFDRLNTGGEKLNPQELRNALYPGHFNKVLITIARSDEFTSVWGIPPQTTDEDEEIPDALSRNTLYKTMADCELVLRFFAIREALTEGRKGSLRRLLDLAMEKHKADDEAATARLQEDYYASMAKLLQLFDGQPFRLPHAPRPSRPLYDALMVSFSLNGATRPLRSKRRIQEGLAEALRDEEKYDILVGRGNTLEAIRQRISLASRILFAGAADA